MSVDKCKQNSAPWKVVLVTSPKYGGFKPIGVRWSQSPMEGEKEVISRLNRIDSE